MDFCVIVTSHQRRVCSFYQLPSGDRRYLSTFVYEFLAGLREVYLFNIVFLTEYWWTILYVNQHNILGTVLGKQGKVKSVKSGLHQKWSLCIQFDAKIYAVLSQICYCHILCFFFSLTFNAITKVYCKLFESLRCSHTVYKYWMQHCCLFTMCFQCNQLSYNSNNGRSKSKCKCYHYWMQLQFLLTKRFKFLQLL